MKFKRMVIILALLGLLLAVLLNLPPVAGLRLAGVVRDAIAPLTRPVARAFTLCEKVFLGGVQPPADNSTVTREAELRMELGQVRSLEQENAELRRLLGLEERLRYRLKAVRVSERSLGGWWQRARLDKGATDGIKPDLPVITAEGLVGRIVEVSAFTADVLLLVDPNSKISARLARKDAFGIVQGQGVSVWGDSLCRMNFIVKEADIRAGDEVVTSGLGGVFPPGLVIGYVEQAFLDRSGLYQFAEIVPAADLRLLEFVFVVLPADNQSAQTEGWE